MAEGCRRLKCKQNIFTTKLSQLLETEREAKNENFFEVLLRFGKNFKPKEDGTVSFMTELQGCLVIQHILNFHKPYKVEFILFLMIFVSIDFIDFPSNTDYYSRF